MKKDFDFNKVWSDANHQIPSNLKNPIRDNVLKIFEKEILKFESHYGISFPDKERENLKKEIITLILSGKVRKQFTEEVTNRVWNSVNWFIITAPKFNFVADAINFKLHFCRIFGPYIIRKSIEEAFSSSI
jgi:hypothetical protein